MAMPTGHTVYMELDQLLAESHAEDTILVTQYEAPRIEADRPLDLETAINDEILAGLVCV